MTSRAGSRGFTLVELVLVMVLLGILVAVAAPRLDLRGFDSAAAAGELVQAIRYAQAMSMAQGGAAGYTVVIGGNGFQVLRDDAPTPDPHGGAASYQATWSGTSVGPTGRIDFDSRGRPDCSEGLTCGEPIVINRGSASSTVRMEAVTGYVR